MRTKLAVFLLPMLSIAGGVAAGLALRPSLKLSEKVNEASPESSGKALAHDHVEKEQKNTSGHEYVKLNNQFVVPVVGRKSIESLVVLSLSVEIEPGQSEIVYSREPKLRDAFLQVLFDHANLGGFQGTFTDIDNMRTLKTALTEVAQSILGDTVVNILITDIARQDV